MLISILRWEAELIHRGTDDRSRLRANALDASSLEPDRLYAVSARRERRGRAPSCLVPGVFARWTGFVALLGAISFLITFVAVIAGTGEDSVFGFGFFPGVLALVIWSIATSIARYRAVATKPTNS